jgi:ubiquinone/menaquinone biosynthesis C-methylase UbiE
MGFWDHVVAQFGKPSGLLGKIAGFIMSKRGSNLERNIWGISLLDLQPRDRVLEIGFGPGIAIHEMSEIITEGIVFGIDHSDVMLDQATQRNKDAIASGKVKLLLASVSNLPSFDQLFDKILDINTFQFLKNPVDDLRKIKAHLRPGGAIVIVHQPRKPGATEKDTDAAGDQFEKYLQQAGFIDIDVQKKIMKPVPTVGICGKA